MSPKKQLLVALIFKMVGLVVDHCEVLTRQMRSLEKSKRGPLNVLLYTTLKRPKKALYGLWRAKMTLTNNANTWYVFPTIVKNKHLGTY